MNDIETIKQEIEYNLNYITAFTAENKRLQDKLNKMELEDWQPDKGDFIVGTTGNVFDDKVYQTGPGGKCKDTTDSEIDFGSVRTTMKQAELASNNMRRFNRLSCFMGDSTPRLEWTNYSVALVFYDYEMDRIEKLKKILDIKGEL
jgi:hypothetical protein